MNKIELKELIVAYDDFIKEQREWLTKNKLVQLPPFNQLHDKNIWGEAYRSDQIYYESVSDAKNQVFAVKSAVIDIIGDTSRSNYRSSKMIADNFLEKLNTDLKQIDEELMKAKQRLKFYETITYVIGNVTYGSF